jgi:cyclopropane fatty-acyl-phospholipid synthase-like methyltransferase
MQQLKFEIDYEAHARGCAPDDFQRQVMRTPFGKPVSKEQVGLIMQAVMDGLAIAPEDMVLDLCCGNGVITDPIFALCAGGVGVDRSAALIGVAKANFERTGERIYVLWDALGYLQMTGDTDRITKMLCYGAFQYLSEQNAAAVESAHDN